MLLAAVRRCPMHAVKPWPKAKVRPIRSHDTHHATASLLMMAGASPAEVQKIMRHSDPRIATEVYGHFAPEYLRSEIGLALARRRSARCWPAAGVRNALRRGPGPGRRSREVAADLVGAPYTIRTCDLRLRRAISGVRRRWQRVAACTISRGSRGRPRPAGAGGRARSHAICCSLLLGMYEVGAARLMTVREVAAQLSVSTATVYALCGRGDLRHVRVANAIRVVAAELEAFVRRRSGGR